MRSRPPGSTNYQGYQCMGHRREKLADKPKTWSMSFYVVVPTAPNCGSILPVKFGSKEKRNKS